MVNGSGNCGTRPGTQRQSGVSAFHRCTCESTIMNSGRAALCVVSALRRSRPTRWEPARGLHPRYTGTARNDLFDHLVGAGGDHGTEIGVPLRIASLKEG